MSVAQQKPQAPSEPPEIAQILSKALLAVTRTKSLQMRLVKLMSDYAKTNRDHILVVVDY